MMKDSLFKKIFILFVAIVTCVSLPTYVYSEENDFKVKRVVSFVCDDSYSMLENGQDYYYANYTLQNMIGMMNENDELNVVYLSNEEKNNMYNMSNVTQRKEYIEELKHYNNYSNKTNFAAIDTAAEYLKSKKELYANDNSYRYYLVVITDGNFNNYPESFTKYLGDLRDYFIGSYYKGIFIGVGDKISDNLKTSVLSNKNYHYISSNGNEDIIKAVFEAHDLIYNRENIDDKYLRYGSENSSISFDAKENVNRVIVLEQNQNAKVKSIDGSNGSMDDYVYFECEKTNEPKLNSVIVHSNNSNGPLEKGNINISFDRPISKSKDNTRIIVEYTGADATERVVESTTIPKSTSENDKENNIVAEEGSENGNPGGGNASGDNGNNNGDENANNTNNIASENGESNNQQTKRNLNEENELNRSKIGEQSHRHFGIFLDCACPCPIFQIILLILLFYLLKKLYDRHRIKKAIKLSYENEDTSHYNQNEYLYNELELNGRRIRKILLLIAIDLLLLILCKILWCRCPGICLCILKWVPGGCAKGFIVPIIPNVSIGNINLINSINPLNPVTPVNPVSPVNPVTPVNPVNPTNSMTPPKPPASSTLPLNVPNYVFPIVPFLVLALLAGYIFKNKFDTRFHGVEKWKGKKRIDDNSIIQVNGFSKFIPFAPQSGSGTDLPIKAAKKVDRVIVPKKFLTSDMKLAGESVDTTRDLILYEDMKLTKLEDGNEVIYIYKYYPGMEEDV